MSKQRTIDFGDHFDDEPSAVAKPNPAPQTGLREPSAADSVDEWVGTRKPRPQGRRPRSSRQAVEKYIDDAKERASSGEWETIPPEQVGGLMAALYVICHERVYKVRPLEVMAPEAFPMAITAAAKQCRECFNSDAHLMAQYLRWVWDRESERHQWRIDNGRETYRIGWRLQFSTTSALFTDYSMALNKVWQRRSTR